MISEYSFDLLPLQNDHLRQGYFAISGINQSCFGTTFSECMTMMETGAKIGSERLKIHWQQQLIESVDRHADGSKNE